MTGTGRLLARRYLPQWARLAVAWLRRGIRDRIAGTAARFATHGHAAAHELGDTVLRIEQPIRSSASFAGKLHNIALGASRIDGIAIAPRQIFSFWRVTGRPSAAAGFRIGRSIRDGEIAGEVGGGLCQVSGIAYQLLLRAGFTVVERHPHSRDLYAEAERFAPLGLDATVVWPFRDLRMASPLAVTVTLRCRVEGEWLVAELLSPVPVPVADIAIDRTDTPLWRNVQVCRNGVPVSVDRYLCDTADGSTNPAVSTTEPA